jgi:hypothetical protein
MLKKLLIVLVVLLVLLIGGAAAVFMRFDGEYGIRRAPMLSYMEYGGAQADIAIRIDPNQARQLILDFVAQQFGDGANDFINNLIADSLPHEIVLMASPRYGDQTIDLTLYVNERRGGPVLARELTNMLAEQAGADTISWDPQGARLERRGVVVLTGETRLHDQTLLDIDRRWGESLPSAPQIMDGGNLFELIAANRKGSLYALVAALAIANPDESNVAVAFALEEIKQLDSMRATANFISEDAVAISMLLQCDRSIEHDRPESMRLMLDQIVLPQLATMLKDSYDLELTGSFVRNGYDLEGAFTLSGLKPIIDQAITAK